MVKMGNKIGENFLFNYSIIEILLSKNLPKKVGQKQNLYRRQSTKLLDKYFFILVSKLDVSEFYECGAHEASASINFARHGKSIAIEANPYTFESKTLLAANHGVTTLNLALGAKNTKSSIFIDLENITSPATSLLNNKLYFKKIQVPMNTLDNIVKLHSQPKSILALWIDVEGSTYDLLLGAIKSLKSKNCRIIKIEMETEILWANQKTFIDLNTFLNKYDFELVCRDIQRTNQFNAVYVKRDYHYLIKDEIINYWSDFLNLKFSYIDYMYLAYGKLHKLKLVILKLKFLRVLVHFISFLLGSKSSRKYLRQVKLKG